MSSVSGTKIHKGIVLSPNSRVTRRAQIIAVKGVTLLTPKSVNDTLNTKFNAAWETPSQPRKRCDDDDENGDKKWLGARSGLGTRSARDWLGLMPSIKINHR